jgi:hypothetical protein
MFSRVTRKLASQFTCCTRCTQNFDPVVNDVLSASPVRLFAERLFFVQRCLSRRETVCALMTVRDRNEYVIHLMTACKSN